MRISPLASLLIGVFLAAAASGSALLGSATAATTQRLPNLHTEPAQDLRLERQGNKTYLRFSAISFNDGDGPLELKGGPVNRQQKKQKVFQCIYSSESSDPVCTSPVGDFVWHPAHNHFHLENYMTYDLLKVEGNGLVPLNRSTSKTSFCVMDYMPHGSTTAPAVYTTCNNQVQGMSVGWADKYGYWLAGQEIDVTGLQNGTYLLRLTVNPQGKLHLQETNTGDNVSDRTFDLVNGTLQNVH
jgi:hypothetical protein